MPFIGNKPSAVPLTSADITDNIIVNADINTNAGITTEKLSLISTASVASVTAKGTPSVSDGYIQLNCEQNSHGIKLKSPPHSAGANYTMVMPNSLGTASQVLRMNSGATALEFATPAAGAFVFLGETTASNVATVDLNGYFTSDYDYYKIFMDGVYGSSNDQAVYIRYATTGSYTVDTGSNYMSASGYQAGFGFSYDYFNTTSYARLTYNGSSTSSNTSNFDFTLFNPLGTNNYKTMTCSWQSSSGDITQYVQGHAALGYKSTTAITGIRFYYSAGNIYARKIKIYGVKNT